MTPDLFNLGRSIGSKVIHALPGMDATDIVGFIAGFLANVTGRIDDQEWEAVVFASKLPCGTPGCVCESMRGPLFETISKLREDWRAWADANRKGKE